MGGAGESLLGSGTAAPGAPRPEPPPWPCREALQRDARAAPGTASHLAPLNASAASDVLRSTALDPGDVASTTLPAPSTLGAEDSARPAVSSRSAPALASTVPAPTSSLPPPHLARSTSRDPSGAALAALPAPSFEVPASDSPRSRRVQSSADALASSAGSKYDSVKIRVWLSEGRSYVLSRFVVAQALARTRIPHSDAVRTSLAVKKALVDAGRLNVSQEDLDAEVIRGMALQGFGEEHARRYTLCSRLFRASRPLLVLVAGPGCAGSSALSRGLASRLNLTHVVQIEMLLELLGDDLPWVSDEDEDEDEDEEKGEHTEEGIKKCVCKDDSRFVGKGSTPTRCVAVDRQKRAPALAPWAHRPRRDGQGIAEDDQGGKGSVGAEACSPNLFWPSIRVSCRLARRSLSGELSKCLRDGRPLVVEGAHVDFRAWAAEARTRGWVWATGSIDERAGSVQHAHDSDAAPSSSLPLVVLPVALVNPLPGPRLDRLCRVVAPSDPLAPSLASLRAVDDFILQGALVEGVPRFSLAELGHEGTLDAVHAHVFDELLRVAAEMEPSWNCPTERDEQL